MFSWILFIHIVGLIIGLGAVTVIDTLGFFSRKSREMTQVTIHAHHITKPLIWIGTLIVFFSWMFVLLKNGFEGIYLIKTLILLVMLINGAFLSFFVSPRLDKLIGKKVLLPNKLQIMISVSLVFSFLSWWSFVVLTVLQISSFL
ncbi:MAG: hypothetical protein PF542_02150 [Nanoarchaeota archaeon]|jgi:hypothetical protein|nr:hypothetical protein [Nanoarchaeota archaeon]